MRLFLILILLITSTIGISKEIVLTKDNTLILDDAFSGESVSKLINEARKMDADLKSGYPIYLFLNTPGGEIQAGLELIEALKGINRPVHTITLYAASMGWQLAQHLGDRYVLSYGVLMSHKASGGFSGEFGGGASQIDSRYGLWLRRLNLMDNQTVNRTKGKKTLKQYRSEYDNELWLNGNEAVENGYADEVVSVKCGKGLEDSRFIEVSFMGLNINVELSTCPIITYPLGLEVNIRTNKGYKKFEDFLNEGGKFGKDCIRKDQEAVITNTWSGEATIVEEPKKAELCATDTSLSFDKIKELKTKTQKTLVKQKIPIRMSFGLL